METLVDSMQGNPDARTTVNFVRQCVPGNPIINVITWSTFLGDLGIVSCAHSSRHPKWHHFQNILGLGALPWTSSFVNIGGMSPRSYSIDVPADHWSCASCEFYHDALMLCSCLITIGCQMSTNRCTAAAAAGLATNLANAQLPFPFYS